MTVPSETDSAPGSVFDRHPWPWVYDELSEEIYDATGEVIASVLLPSEGNRILSAITELRTERDAAAERAADLTWFWEIVDRDGLANLPSCERQALADLCQAAARANAAEALHATLTEASNTSRILPEVERRAFAEGVEAAAKRLDGIELRGTSSTDPREIAAATIRRCQHAIRALSPQPVAEAGEGDKTSLLWRVAGKLAAVAHADGWDKEADELCTEVRALARQEGKNLDRSERRETVAVPTANCCHCGRIVDTREKKDGGDDFGMELSDGRWLCSDDCWEIVVPLPGEPAAPSPSPDRALAVEPRAPQGLLEGSRLQIRQWEAGFLKQPQPTGICPTCSGEGVLVASARAAGIEGGQS